MSGTTDALKGQIKEAAGALTNNDKLREAGKADQVAGKVKQAEAAEKAARKAEDAAEKAEATQRANADTKEFATERE